MNEVLLYGDIYQGTSRDFIKAINEADSSDDLTVRVNTGGGSVEYGWGMIAKFNEYPSKKNVIVDGIAASMGAFFCVYADNVECYDFSEFMIHRASYPSYIEDSEQFTGAIKDNLIRINSSLEKALRNKIDVEAFEEIAGESVKKLFSLDSKTDVYLTAKQAKKIGLVSKVNKISAEKRASIKSKAFEIAASREGISVSNIKNKVQTNNEKMTLEELQAKHPNVFEQAVAMGVAQEKKEGSDRVGAWMKFNDVDPKAVAEGIASGENISQTAMADFSMKIAQSNVKAVLEDESASVVETGQEERTANDAEGGNGTDKTISNVEASIDSMLGLKK